MSGRSLLQITDNIKSLSSKFTFDRNKQQHVRLSLITFAKDVKVLAYSIPSVEKMVEILNDVNPDESEAKGNYTRALLECKKIIRDSRDTSRDVIIMYGSSPYT
ncbi:hypothetical protein OESDEN_24006 [Oesophagostomum dentatum]|uniref:VWFA domain-containing protein n=1 Tax=Oesophagostomum dentatum TaxID=61180 RepID=A0A0B1RUK7_OESDE|nr:hypothetical protein OESDEN_24006 [Oesophagostomum dentatum]